MAADWDWGASAGLSSVYDDNPTLSNDDDTPEDTFRFLAFYELELQNVGPQKGFSISPRISRDYYPDSDKSDLESTDYDVPGEIFYSTPTSRWSLDFGFTRQNILSSESIVEAPGDATNSFRADDTVFNYNLSPSVSWNASSKDQIVLNAVWRKQDYDLDYTGRSDFDGYSINSSYLRAVTERQSLGLTVNFSSSESNGLNCRDAFTDPLTPRPAAIEPCDGAEVNQFITLNAKNRNETDAYNITLDYTWRIQPTLNLRASIGREKVDSVQRVVDFDGTTLLFDGVEDIGGIFIFTPTNKIESDAENETYNIGLTKELERGSWNISAARGTRLQSSTGTPQDSDTYRFNFERRLSKRLFMVTRFAYSTQESVFLANDDNDTGASREQQFYSAQGTLRYRLDRKWSIVGTYRWRKRDRDPRTITSNADSIISTSNQYRVGITYAFKQLQ